MSNKYLRIVECGGTHRRNQGKEYGNVLVQLAVAQSNLVQAGIKSALPHFIAIVKKLEEMYGFSFEQVELENEKQHS